MNVAQNAQQKRSIRVRDFLRDFRSGMTDEDLMESYHLSPMGLEKFFSMLQERGILSDEELSAARQSDNLESESDWPTETTESGFICPSCSHAQGAAFEICPECGVSVQEFFGEGAASGSAQPLEGPGFERNYDDIFSEWDAAEKQIAEDAAFSQEAESAIELPLEQAEKQDQPVEETKEAEKKPLFQLEDFQGGQSAFDNQEEEVVSALPFDLGDLPQSGETETAGVCDSCSNALYPDVRPMYEASSSRLGLVFAGAFLLLGILGAWALTMFDGYSVTRLVVIYGTGLSMFLGTIFLAMAIAMRYLAREKVFCCHNCGRVYPRR